MTEMTGAPPARRWHFADWTHRYRTPIELVIAAMLGLVGFPLVFTALQPHDVLLGEKISLVDVVWLILALVASVVVLRARAALVQLATRAADQLSASLPASEESKESSGSAATFDRDAQDRGRFVARALLDLVFLLVIQAMLRAPLVGAISGVAPESWIDGGYVVVVVLIALALLVTINRQSKPLIERVIWVGLNQVVPTAGFATTRSVAATYSTHLATTSARLATSSQSAHHEPAQSYPPAAASSADAPTVVASLAETIAAPPPLQNAPAVVAEATVLAPDPSVAATILAPVASTEAKPTIATGSPSQGVATIMAGEPARASAAAEAAIVNEPPANPIQPTETIVASEPSIAPVQSTETIVASEPPRKPIEPAETIVVSESTSAAPRPNDGKDGSP